MVNKFLKYHGAGNDFVIIDRRKENSPPPPEAVKLICDRHFGVGADGVLSLLDANIDGAQFYMHITNSDGSVPEMCGNGIRCFTQFLYDTALIKPPIAKIQTDAGVKTCRFGEYDKEGGFSVTVEMGAPKFSGENLPERDLLENGEMKISVTDNIYQALPVSMGNPHAVIFYNEATKEIALQDGPVIEKNPLFTAGANVEFVKPTGKNEAEVFVWERGAGFTLACGTGACAVAAAGVKKGVFDAGTEICLKLPGGDLHIIIERDYKNALMRGPSQKVFKATLNEKIFTI